MEYSIKGVHYDVTDVTKEFIETKVQKLSFAENHIVDFAFTLTKGPRQWDAEANLHLKWGSRLHMSETAFNLHEALEKLIDRLDHQVSKEKEKVQDHHHG